MLCLLFPATTSVPAEQFVALYQAVFPQSPVCDKSIVLLDPRHVLERSISEAAVGPTEFSIYGFSYQESRCRINESDESSPTYLNCTPANSIFSSLVFCILFPPFTMKTPISPFSNSHPLLPTSRGTFSTAEEGGEEDEKVVSLVHLVASAAGGCLVGSLISCLLSYCCCGKRGDGLKDPTSTAIP
jgi:hypothetical protein